MLRRKPTALTITAEDISSFEDLHARRLAYLRFQKTGEDPEGLFRDTNNNNNNSGSGSSNNSGSNNGTQNKNSNTGGVLDPNDELKPLPGDKARIVRSREERIMGGAGGGGAGAAGGR